MEGKAVDDTTTIPAETRIRRSCGCPGESPEPQMDETTDRERDKLLLKDSSYLGQALMTIDSCGVLLANAVKRIQILAKEKAWSNILGTEQENWKRKTGNGC